MFWKEKEKEKKKKIIHFYETAVNFGMWIDELSCSLIKTIRDYLPDQAQKKWHVILDNIFTLTADRKEGIVIHSNTDTHTNSHDRLPVLAQYPLAFYLFSAN